MHGRNDEFNSFCDFPTLAYYWISILKQSEKYREQLEQKQRLGYAALEVMEQHLKHRNYFVEETYTIADICLYAYTHVAEEGGFNLRFPHILAWFERIQAHSRHILITTK